MNRILNFDQASEEIARGEKVSPVSWWALLRCRIRHDWRFRGGYWFVGREVALTYRRCVRCHLNQEVSQNHVFPNLGFSFVERQWIL